MTMMILQSSTAYPLPFVLVSSSDHISGLTGKAGTVTVKITKNGASGVTPSGAITEVDATNLPGHYQIAGNATDTGTIGYIGLYAKDAASDPVSDPHIAQVVGYDPTATPATAPTNWSTLVIDGSGRVDVGKIVGQVLKTSGSGGQSVGT